MLTLNHYLIVSGLLFAIGLSGVLIRRNIIVIFMCLEIMLSAASLSLVAFSRFNVVAADSAPAIEQLNLSESAQSAKDLATKNAGFVPNYNAQVLVFFIITVAAAEVAIGLAIIVALYRARQTVQVDRIASMRH